MTGANVNRNLAIVLDNRIQSAPVIESQISERGEITHLQTIQESSDLALLLRSGALPHTDFRVPEDVLGALNRAYQMDDHGQLYFTIWYGVYHRPTGTLRYASAGHPAAMQRSR